MPTIDTFIDRYGNPIFKIFLSAAHIRTNQIRQHRHTEFELSLILSGKGIYKTERGNTEIEKGDVFLFSTNEYHCITDIFPADGQEYMELLNIQFAPSFIPGNIPQENVSYMNVFFRRNESFLNRLDPKNPCGDKIRLLFAEIREECENKRPCYATQVRNKLVDILILILRDYGIADFTAQEKDCRRYSENLQKAVAYMNEHYTENITLDEIVSCARLTKTHFLDLFRAAYRMTTWDYINIRRIDHAAQLLLSSDRTILDIATQSGFNNTANFNRIFKKITGVTRANTEKTNIDEKTSADLRSGGKRT